MDNVVKLSKLKPHIIMKRIIVMLLLAVNLSCQKEEPTPAPTVSFDVVIGDEGKVRFKVDSKNADSFTWDFGDGNTSNVNGNDYVYLKNGEYKVTLTAVGRGGTVSVIRDVKIDNITGSVIFWMQAMKGKDIEVYVAKRLAGQIRGIYSSGVAPECGGALSATLSGLPEGTYAFEAKEMGVLIPAKWVGTVNIVGRTCSKLKLQY